MKNQFRYLLNLLFVISVFQISPAQTPADLPFVVELEEGTYDDWPGLHSFAFGEWQGYWVFIGAAAMAFAKASPTSVAPYSFP